MTRPPNTWFADRATEMENEMSDARREAFELIMGDSSMPKDESPEYDEWLFNKTWQACEAAMQGEIEPAKVRYDKFMKGEIESDPIERLRFFLSLSLNGQDWLDVEPFLDEIRIRA